MFSSMKKLYTFNLNFQDANGRKIYLYTNNFSSFGVEIFSWKKLGYESTYFVTSKPLKEIVEYFYLNCPFSTVAEDLIAGGFYFA
jgi:hypothetical protein